MRIKEKNLSKTIVVDDTAQVVALAFALLRTLYVPDAKRVIKMLSAYYEGF